MNRIQLLSLLVLTAMPALALNEVYDSYLKGLAEERAGHAAKALAEYEKVVQRDPNALEVYRDIAQLNLRLGRTDAALRAAERVRDLAPTDPSSFLFIGNVRVAEGNLAKAAESYEQALQLDPKNLPALENLANYYAMVDPPKAVTYYQRCLDIDPRDAETRYQLGTLYLKLGDAPKARKAFEQSAKDNPREAAPLVALGGLAELQYSTAAAMGHYEKASQLRPEDPNILLRLGHLRYEMKEWEAARSAFQGAALANPRDAAAPYWLARVSEELKQWDQAARYAQQAYEIANDPQFIPLTAYYLTLNRRTAEAVTWLEKARQRNPDGANILLFLGMDYLELEKPKQAQEVLAHGVSKHPDDIQLRFQLGIAHDKLGRFEEAEKQFETVLQLDPQNAAAMNYLGYSWAERGIKFEQAEKYLRQAVSLDPNNGAYLDSLGWLRFKQGDRGEAIRWLKQAVERTPDALIYDHLGDVYAADENMAGAAAAWSRAASIDPSNDRVREKLKKSQAAGVAAADPERALREFLDNQNHLKDLSAGFLAQGRWNRQPLRANGKMRYQKPAEVTLQLDAPKGRVAPKIIMKNGRFNVDPPVSGTTLQSLPWGTLSVLPDFFSGDLGAPFTGNQVQISTGTSEIRYQTPDGRQAWIDPSRGMLTRFERRNPSSGRDELSVNRYEFASGVWLPAEISIRNADQGWKLKVTFSSWTFINP